MPGIDAPRRGPEARDRVPGLEGMWFHDLRKTALTAFAAAGATNGEVMHIAGHTSLDVASIYQQSLDSHLDDVYRRLESGGRGEAVRRWG